MQGAATQGWHLLNSAQNGSLSMGKSLRQDDIMLWAKKQYTETDVFEGWRWEQCSLSVN